MAANAARCAFSARTKGHKRTKCAPAALHCTHKMRQREVRFGCRTCKGTERCEHGARNHSDLLAYVVRRRRRIAMTGSLLRQNERALANAAENQRRQEKQQADRLSKNCLQMQKQLCRALLLLLLPCMCVQLTDDPVVRIFCKYTLFYSLSPLPPLARVDIVGYDDPPGYTCDKCNRRAKGRRARLRRHREHPCSRGGDSLGSSWRQKEKQARTAAVNVSHLQAKSNNRASSEKIRACH